MIYDIYNFPYMRNSGIFDYFKGLKYFLTVSNH